MFHIIIQQVQPKALIATIPPPLFANADVRLKCIVVSANSIKIQFGLDYSEDQDKSKELEGPLYTSDEVIVQLCVKRSIFICGQTVTLECITKSLLSSTE